MTSPALSLDPTGVATGMRSRDAFGSPRAPRSSRCGARPTGDVAEDGLGKAAVDADVLAGDVTRQRADEKLDDVRDILGLADPCQRDDAFPRLLDLRVGIHLLGHRRVGHTR